MINSGSIGLRGSSWESFIAALRALHAGSRHISVRQCPNRKSVIARLVAGLSEQHWCRVLVLVNRDSSIIQTRQHLEGEGIDISDQVVLASAESALKQLPFWRRRHFDYVVVEGSSPESSKAIQQLVAGGAKIIQAK